MSREIKFPGKSGTVPGKAPLTSFAWVGIAGLAFSLAAFIFSLLLLSGVGEDWYTMLYAAPLAAFLSGFFGWGILVIVSKRVTLWKGVGAGALIGLIAHPLTWYFAILFFYFSGARSSLGEPTLNPVEGLWASLLYSLLSWLFVGWLTVPIGAAIGGILAYIQSKRISASGSFTSAS